MRIFCVVCILLMTACTSIPQNQGAPATVREVVEKIKADVDAYEAYIQPLLNEPPLSNACHGDVQFDISSVKISLNTQTDNTTTADGSLVLPVGTGIFGSTSSFSHEAKRTQVLTFTLYPKKNGLKEGKKEGKYDHPLAINSTDTPIAYNIKKLRKELLAASHIKTCFSLTPLKNGKIATNLEDDGGTLQYGFIVINRKSINGGLKFVIFSLGTGFTSQNEVGNSITVTFKARPGNGMLMQQ